MREIAEAAHVKDQAGRRMSKQENEIMGEILISTLRVLPVHGLRVTWCVKVCVYIPVRIL